MTLVFRQLQDPTSSTYTYLLADPATREAILIDPVFEQAARDSALLRELGLKLICTVDTHVHADHITAAWQLKETHGSRIAISAAAGAAGADIRLKAGDRIAFGSRALEARATPGHTDGCMSFVLDDRSMVFTGDALLIRGSGRTDFQQGSARTLFESVRRELFTLPDECLVYPAHDYRGLTASSIGEERKHNPRLGGERNEGDFEGTMQNLGLAHPKQIEHAVPANLVCGRIPAATAPAVLDWAPLQRSYAGIDEVDPEWVATHGGEALVIDVREPDEFVGPLGHIDGAELVPLRELAGALGAIPRDKPIVTVCRSGGRSAQAFVLLKRAGVERVANLGGGMLRWHENGLPVSHRG
jgi:glyoxylase-like metal-dependent hydrolase (beta-lactamase superfamily II)/rhodanese-related sulfurtransferase